MREKGGTEYSILRTNFLNWDADKSGEIGPEEFRGAMSILGLKLSPSEAKSICDYYDVEGDGEMKYQPLVDDVTKGTSHFLVHPHTERKATPKTPTTDLALAEKIKEEDALFSARQRKRPPNAVVEAFKKRLRHKLEMTMRATGGTIYSICREAFLLWDGDCSGELNVQEFQGAIKKMGLDCTESEATQIVKFYDLEGDGEMRYQELVKDIVEGVPHFMVHPDTKRMSESRGTGRGARGGRQPVVVDRIQEKIRNSANDAAGKSVTRISGEDLFYGTCIRFDKENTGKLSRETLQRGVLRSIGCALSSVEMRHLIGWYEDGGNERVAYKEIVRNIFGNAHQGKSTARRDRDAISKVLVKTDKLTSRGKRAGVLAEKARIERRIKDIIAKEKNLEGKLKTLRTGRRA